MKVISLVPSLTELLIYLGVKVVGRTKFCVHPTKQILNIPIIGGTKTVDIDKISALNADLVIANKEENVKDQIDSIISLGTEVLVTEISTTDDALESILIIGRQVNKVQASQKLYNDILESFNNIKQANLSVCYLIWKSPWMTVGGDTYINSILSILGYSNVFMSKERYPSIEIIDIKMANPDIIFLSSEPFPFKEKHIKALNSLLPNTRIELVDGTYFSWYGNRMKQVVEYAEKLHNRLNS